MGHWRASGCTIGSVIMARALERNVVDATSVVPHYIDADMDSIPLETLLADSCVGSSGPICLLLLSDVGGSGAFGSLALPKVKTTNGGSQLQTLSVITEDEGLLQFMDSLFGEAHPRALLCPGGQIVKGQR
eukprot:4088583-Amphidinium_carterae.1